MKDIKYIKRKLKNIEECRSKAKKSYKNGYIAGAINSYEAISNTIESLPTLHKKYCEERKLNSAIYFECVKLGDCKGGIIYSRIAAEKREEIKQIEKQYNKYAEIHAEVLCELGNLYLQKNNINKAAISYNKVLKLYKDGMVEFEAIDVDKICYKLSHVLLQIYCLTQNTGYLEKVADLYVKGINTYNSNEFLEEIVQIGKKCYDAGLYDKAIECYKKLLSFEGIGNKNASIMHYQIAKSYIAQEKFADGINFCKSGLKLDANNIKCTALMHKANQAFINQMQEEYQAVGVEVGVEEVAPLGDMVVEA